MLFLEIVLPLFFVEAYRDWRRGVRPLDKLTD